MASPNLQPFDASTFQRAKIDAVGTVGKSIQSGLQIAAPAIKAAKTNKAINNEIDDIMQVEEEQYRHTANLYGKPVMNEGFSIDVPMDQGTTEPLINAESFNVPEGKKLNPAFTRTAQMKEVTPESGKAFTSYLSQKRKQLGKISNHPTLKPAEKMDLLDTYKTARANYLTKVTTFQQGWGKDAIQWIEPSVNQYIADPDLKEIYQAKVDTFVKEGKGEYFQSKIKQYMQRPEVKEAMAAHRKALADGKVPTDTIVGTTDDFYSWLIDNNGVPDTSMTQDGQKLPENLQQGRFHGKVIAELGKAENRAMVENFLDSASKRTGEMQKAQEIGVKKDAVAKSKTEQAAINIQKINTKTQNELDLQINKAEAKQLKIDGKLQPARKQAKIGAARGSAKKLVKDLEAQKIKADIDVADADNMKQVYAVFHKLVADGVIDNVAIPRTELARISQEVWGDDVESKHPVALEIEKVLRTDIFEDDEETSADTSDLDISRVKQGNIGNVNQSIAPPDSGAANIDDFEL